MSEQDLGIITATYDPAADTLTFSTSSVTVFPHRKGKITVKLQLKPGSTGTVALQNPPVLWTTTPPQKASVLYKSSTEAEIRVPHRNATVNDVSHIFQLKYTYTPPNQNPVDKTGGNATVTLQGYQPLTLTATYDPSTQQLSCSASSFTVNKERTGRITVNLQVKGGTGTIKFKDGDPLDWETLPPFWVSPVSNTQVFIFAPNSPPPVADRSYDFQINYIYTPNGGTPVSGTGDPTIMLEGTGGMGQGHGQGQGQGHGQGHGS